MLHQQSTTKNQISPSSAPSSNQLLSIPTEEDDVTARRGGSPPWWRRRGGIIGIAIVLLIILLGGILISLLNRPKPVTYEEQRVTQGNISLTVNATGPLQSALYNLIFVGTGGKIDSINVKVGDSVKKGQVLAQLDKTLLQDAVNQQQSAVNAAQASLNAALVTAGATGSNGSANVNAAQTGLNNAQASLNQTQNVSDATVAADQTALDNAQKQLQSTMKVANAQISAAAATRDQAIANCNNNATAVASATAAAKAPPQPSTNGNGNSNGSSTSAGAGGAGPTLIPDCKQVAQNAYNQTVATAHNSVTTAQLAVNTAQQNLNTAQAQAASNNTTAQNAVNTAKSSVNTASSGAGVSNASSQSAVTSAQGQLANAQALLTQAQHNLANATLTAPHDGIVSIINGTVGGAPGVPPNTATSTGSAASGSTFIQIVDTSVLQIQANINESDTANLKVGQPATFTVTSYNDRIFHGTLSAISPIGQTVSNVVSYPVTIDVDMNDAKGANLLPNMTANVTVTVVQHNNVLLIPVNAVNFARLASSGNAANGTPQLITKQQAASALSDARQMMSNLEASNPSVSASSPMPAYVLEELGGKFTAKPVVLGLTDGTSYEVLSGLAVGEPIIVGTQQNGLPAGAGSSGGAGGSRGG